MPTKTISYKEVRDCVQRWAILSDERMPKSDYDSFREIEKWFLLVGKLAMFIDMGLEVGFDEEEAEAVDSIKDVIKFLENNGIVVKLDIK